MGWAVIKEGRLRAFTVARRGLQPRLKRLILPLSLKDHRRNIPAFGYTSRGHACGFFK
jgi:hypothetical protein